MIGLRGTSRKTLAGFMTAAAFFSDVDDMLDLPTYQKPAGRA